MVQRYFKHCVQCNGPKTGTTKFEMYRKYCSDSCRDAGRLGKKTEVAHLCKACGKAFLGSKKSKFCSDQCRVSSYGAMARCLNCKIEYRRHTSAKSERSFCSKACGHELSKRETYERNKRNCQQCGAEFSRFPKANDTRMFCSKVCAKRNQAPAISALLRERYGSAPFSKVYFGYCAWCAEPAKMKDGRARTCSDTCGRSQLLSTQYKASGSKEWALPAYPGVCAHCDEWFMPMSGRGNKRNRMYCSGRCADLSSKQNRKSIERSAHATGDRLSWWKMGKAQGWRCAVCDVSTPADLRGTTHAQAPEIDHIVPLARGGTHTHANTWLLCRQCNGSKQDKMMHEWFEFLSSESRTCT